MTENYSQASNPYQPPIEALPSQIAQPYKLSFDWPALLSWPFAMGINLVIPMLIAWDITSRGGRGGMWLAIGLFLVSGWILCLVQPQMARRLIVGSVALAFTQFFPLIQLFAGILAFSIMNFLGWTSFPDTVSEQHSDPIVFLVTVIVGLCLATVAFVLGAAFWAVARLWRRSNETALPVPIDSFQNDPSKQ